MCRCGPRSLAVMRRVAGRDVAAAVLAVVVAASVGGCNSGNLSRRELVVHFDPAAPASDHVAVRAACATAAPHASPEPAPAPTSRGIDSAYDVRFRIDHASDRDINQLVQCLRHQHGVVGEDIPDAGG